MSPAVEQPLDFEHRVQKLREIYADATEISKTALENVIRSVQSGAPGTDSAPMESAGRIGAHRGKVSELTTLLPIKPTAAKRMRAFLELLHGSLGNQGVDKVGTVHDMRFVFLDNDTKLLFCTAYDGDWDPTSTTSGPRSPTSWTFSSARSKGGREFAARRSKTHREAPDPGLLLVCRQSEFDCGGDQATREDWQGGRRIPRQGGLTNKFDDDGGAHRTPPLSDVRAAQKERAVFSSQDRYRGEPSLTRASIDLHEIQAYGAALSAGAVLRHARPAPHRRCARAAASFCGGSRRMSLPQPTGGALEMPGLRLRSAIPECRR